MWQNLLRHCAVLTKVSEEFAPHYLAGIRHDMRQTTELRVIASRRSSFGVQLCGNEFDDAVRMLSGQSQETIESVLGASGMNSLTTLALKHALGTRR